MRGLGVELAEDRQRLGVLADGEQLSRVRLALVRLRGLRADGRSGIPRGG